MKIAASLIGLVGVGILGLACSSSKPKPATPASPVEVEIGTAPIQVDPAVLDRGTYVATITGCVVCHSPIDASGMRVEGRLFAGGRELRADGGEGVARTPNISPDVATGIGDWTDDEIERAIRTGIRADGSRMLPVMPYQFFQYMSDGDVNALVVYLRAQAPVARAVPRNHGVAMQAEIVTPPAMVPEPTLDPMVRGEYLANLMRCASCHTPETGAHVDQPFAGGRAFDNPITAGGGTLYSANITSDPVTGIGTWTTEDIMRAVRGMVRPDGTPLRGPMAMFRDGWSRLTDDDARALAIYIKSIRPIENEIVHAQRQARLSRGGARQTSMP